MSNMFLHPHTIAAIMNGVVGFNPIEHIKTYFLNFLSTEENTIIYPVSNPSSDEGVQECFEIAKRVQKLFTNTDSVVFLQFAINFINDADLSVPAEYYRNIINAMILDLTTFMLSNETQMKLCLNSFIEEAATEDRAALTTTETLTIYLESAQLLAEILQLPLLKEIGHDAVQNGLLTLTFKCYELNMDAIGNEISLSIDPFLIIDAITVPISIDTPDDPEFANSEEYQIRSLDYALNRLDTTNIEVQQILINTMLKCTFSKNNGQYIRLRPFIFAYMFSKITDNISTYLSIIHYSILQSIEFIFLCKIITHIMFLKLDSKKQMVKKAIQFKDAVFAKGILHKKNVNQSTYGAICRDFKLIKERLQENVNLGYLEREYFKALIDANIFTFYKDILVCIEHPSAPVAKVATKVSKKKIAKSTNPTQEDLIKLEEDAKAAEYALMAMLDSTKSVVNKAKGSKKSAEEKAAKKAAKKAEEDAKKAAKDAKKAEEEKAKKAAENAKKAEEKAKKAEEKTAKKAAKKAAKNEEAITTISKDIAELTSTMLSLRLDAAKAVGAAKTVGDAKTVGAAKTVEGARTVEDNTFGIKPIVERMGCAMIITGSRAYRIATPDSDLDTLVLISSKTFPTINNFVNAFCHQICSNSNIQYCGNFSTTNCTIINLFIVDANISVDISIVIVYMEEEDTAITRDILDKCIKNPANTSSPKVMCAISDTRHIAEAIDRFGQYKPLFISATLQIKEICKANKMCSSLNGFFKSLSIVVMVCRRFISLDKEQLDEALIIRDFFQYYADGRNWTSEVINCGYIEGVSVCNHTNCAQIASPSGTILLSMKFSEFSKYLDRFQQISIAEDPRCSSYNYEDFNCRLYISIDISRTDYDLFARNIDDMVKSSMLLRIMAIRTEILKATNAIVIPDIDIIKSGASTYSGMLLMSREITELLCQEHTRSNTEEIISDIITRSRYLYCSQYFDINLTHSIALYA